MPARAKVSSLGSLASRAGCLGLPAQRADAAALAEDAQKRGWITEADRHQALITRLDALISQAQAG